jgi:hypothetical protein
MKKLLALTVVLLLTAGFAMADIMSGSAPQSHNVTVDVIIPPRVGIDIAAAEHNKILDLTTDLTYPPAVATYWTVGTNLISVLSLITYDFTYSCAFAGPVGSTLVMGDLEYQTNGATWLAPITWTAFAAGPVTLENDHARTGGWEARNMDYRVNLDGSETDGTHTWTLTYTMTTP